MLAPKKIKHRKMQKGRGRFRQVDTRGTTLTFGKYGLKALEEKWLTAREIEAARKAIAFVFRKEGKVWMRVFPDKPITRKPPEVTMGGGKGDVEFYVFPVKPGRVIFEIDGVSENVAREALRLAASKLSIKTQFIKKE